MDGLIVNIPSTRPPSDKVWSHMVLPMSSLARILALTFVLLPAGCRTAVAAAPATAGPVALQDSDRVLVLAPHPDDEVLGAGGVLREAARRGLPVRVVFLTHGDSNEWSFLAYRKRPVLTPAGALAMGAIRHQEALAAAAVLGVPAQDLIFLGYPDFGTLDIWRSHWGSRLPARGRLTRARAVPYANAFRPGAPYKGEAILADLETILRDFRPTQIFVSHPADHHPDHAALYLFTRVALWDLQREMAATVHPFLVHFPGWPAKGLRPNQ
jgi:LmbE family N-acetylglucosaminyl deacetylase